MEWLSQVWKIIVIWECVPERQGIASLDCDWNPLKQDLCLESLWIDGGDSLSDVVCELDCFRVPGTSCFQSEWNKIVNNTQMFVFFFLLEEAALSASAPALLLLLLL